MKNDLISKLYFLLSTPHTCIHNDNKDINNPSRKQGREFINLKEQVPENKRGDMHNTVQRNTTYYDEHCTCACTVLVRSVYNANTQIYCHTLHIIVKRK